MSTISQSPSTRVLVVCLGNICRSPIGEAVLKDVAAKRGFDIYVDSAGTASYHVGEKPDERAIAVCRKYGVPISHKGRQISKNDFKSFTHILAADNWNLEYLERMKPSDGLAKVHLWGSYLDGKPIGDPYYGGIEEFEACLRQITALSGAFLDKEVVDREAPDVR